MSRQIIAFFRLATNLKLSPFILVLYKTHFRGKDFPKHVQNSFLSEVDSSLLNISLLELTVNSCSFTPCFHHFSFKF